MPLAFGLLMTMPWIAVWRRSGFCTRDDRIYRFGAYARALAYPESRTVEHPRAGHQSAAISRRVSRSLFRRSKPLLDAGYREDLDATLFLGARLWKGAQGYVNSEIDQGFGLNGTVGVADFPSGEAYKVGAAKWYERLQRYYVRQTFNYGGGSQAVKSAANQLAGSQDADRLTLTFGKYSVVDFFDNNTYAHDPRNDFMNWGIIDMGAFDYAADSWGYTRGLTAEYTRANAAFRMGVFQLSATPNKPQIEPQFLRQFSPAAEYERNTSLFGGHPGKVRALAYGDYGFMTPLVDAIRTPPRARACRLTSPRFARISIGRWAAA